MWRGLTALVLLGAVVVGLLVGSGRFPSWRQGPSEPAISRVEAPTPTVEEPVVHVPVVDTPPPGEPFSVELIEEPADRYAAAQPTEADNVYSAVVAQLGRPDVVYDPNLGHAARELAYQHSVLGGLVPRPVVDFLLRSGGAVDRTVVQAYTATSGDDLSAVASRVERLVGTDRRRLRRVGIGEAYVPGARHSRYIAILVSERSLQVNPAPRAALPGGKWVLSGTLPEGWADASGLGLYPDGRLVHFDVMQEGRRFTLEVDVGETEGQLEVSLSAVGPHGPSPLVQVPVVVGTELPTVLESWMPPDESDVVDAESAETLAFRLLNADRVRFGLEPLVRDRSLDAVARAHSVDMRDGGYFGHWSEETGSPGDRLAAADVKAVTFAENVAFGASIHGAEEGLMHSLGHRRNILERRFTHVGIGVAGKTEGKAVRWYLTQLFSRPAANVNPVLAERHVLTRLDGMRRQNGRRALARDRALDALAGGAAQVAAAGGTDDLAKVLLENAREDGQTRRGAFAWVRVVSDPDSVTLPDQATDPMYTRIGVGIVQLPDHPNGLVGVALLLAGDR